MVGQRGHFAKRLLRLLSFIRDIHEIQGTYPLKIQIDGIKQVSIQKLMDKGLISEYLLATVPYEDRMPAGDIDILGILS